MKNNTNNELLSSVEKGFSSYVKSCLIHKRMNFFKNYDEENNRLKSLNDLNQNSLLISMGYTTQFTIFEEGPLFEALYSLNSFEKKLLYLKFHQEKTDQQIAKILGVSRQAVTKAKKKLLEKMKKKLEM